MPVPGSIACRWLVLSACLFLALLSGVAPARAATRPSTREILQRLGGTLCPNSRFTCVTLTVPLDHFNPADSRTIEVVFAVLPAKGTRKGMFVTATGGPGVAGISLADSYTAALARSIRQHFDLVFFDPRGVGLSGGLTCPEAAVRFYASPWRADTPAHERRLKRSAETFARECNAAMGQPEMLPYLGTAQAVEDLEQFRALMQDEKFWLYGESYGTQYAQTYAAAHGEHLAGLILDGVVDLTLDGLAFYAHSVQAFNDTLVASLRACAAHRPCANDFGQNPLRVYDRLARMLKQKSLAVSYPLSTGARAPRRFTFGDLETVGQGQMYGEDDRMLFVRALAAWARDGDLVPLARLLYPNLGMDPETLATIPDPSFSDAMYYAVECQDYGYYVGTPDERARQYLAVAKPVEASGLRLSSLIYGDLPCVYWRDSSQDLTRPPYLRAEGIPTLVLNALADPITPLDSARAVYEHLADGYLILQRGGPHVIFGRGNRCPDDIVTAFLVQDQRPPSREMECPGDVMSAYVPLAPLEARAFASPLDALESAETEIYYLPEFYYWDYETPGRAGCAQRGSLHFTADDTRVYFGLNECAFSRGFEMSGTGEYDFRQDRFTLNVRVAGDRNCHLYYERHGQRTKVYGSCGQVSVKAEGESQASPILGGRERAKPAPRN